MYKSFSRLDLCVLYNNPGHLHSCTAPFHKSESNNPIELF